MIGAFFVSQSAMVTMQVCSILLTASKIEGCILTDRHVTAHEIAADLSLSIGSVESNYNFAVSAGWKVTRSATERCHTAA